MDRDSLSIGVSLLALAVDGDKPPAWIQLTPVSQGTFTAVDGRKFTLDNAQGVVDTTLADGLMRVDLNHGTQLAAKGGHAAPAVAWIDTIALHGPAKEAGLWGHVDNWTPAGAKAVTDKEYRFVSPELEYVKKTGQIVKIKGAGLTNDPALLMTGLFHNNQETTTLDPKKIRAALGLPETASDNDVMQAIEKLGAGNTAMSACAKQIAQAAGLDVANFTVLDEKVTTALCTKLKTSTAAGDATEVATLSAKVAELSERVLTLTTANTTKTAAEAVDAAIKGGKITPAQRGDALELCTRDPDRFAKFVANAPTVLASGRIAPAGSPEEGLDMADLALCAAMNIDPKDFKATRKAQQEVLS